MCIGNLTPGGANGASLTAPPAGAIANSTLGKEAKKRQPKAPATAQPLLNQAKTNRPLLG